MNKLFLLFLLWGSTLSHSQTVQLIVPFTAGGVNDRVTRVLEKTLAKRLPYNFVVEYQTGAGGIIAANAVAKNNSKDTVLLVHSAAIATNTFNPNATYNLFQDFVPVARLGAVPMVLVANRQSTVSSVKQLKHINTPILYGSAGTGTASHVAGELLQQQINQDLTPVFYKGESAAFNDILSNSVPMMFVSVSTVASYATSPHVSILAVTGTARNAKIPSVPTFAEQGVKGFERSPNWLVIVANPSSDPVIIARIKTALSDSVLDNSDIELYTRAGVEINRYPAAYVTEFLTEEVDRMQKLQARMKLQK
jgi:tripartite-type tricarboxylate transporter receptor subunit TctC